MRSVFQVTLLVRDYDEAIEFYVNLLGFQLIEDTILDADKRWVVVGVDQGCAILLAKATNDQLEALGKQAGGRVAFFLGTDDIKRDVSALSSKGVKFLRPATEMEYGTVAVFEDLYGNPWDLIQHVPDHRFSLTE